MILSISSCREVNRLVIYSDPWLGEWVSSLVETWEKDHPEVKVELRLLSSEVVAAHLREGQDIDLFFYLESPQASWEIEEEKVHKKQILGEDFLCRVEVLGELREELGGKGCLAWSGTGRPLRVLAETRKKALGIKDQDCKVVADFYPQLKHYLLEGWVSEGIVLGSFAQKHGERLAISRMDTFAPLQKGVIQIEDALHPQWQQDFYDFCLSEKTRMPLAREVFVP